MKTAWAAILLVITGAAAGASPQGIDGFIRANLASSGAPGIAYAAVDAGTISTGADGVTRRGSADPVTADTPFRIGSVTKSFTALAIMQLHERGLIGLDATVATYLPAFGEGPLKAVTIRQLLSHTSGLSTVQGNRLHGDLDGSGTGLAAYAGELARLDPAYPAGARFEYSNANYQILGAVIERVSGQSYAAYVESRILAPLAMTHTSIDSGRADPAIATGHRPWFGGNRPFEPEATDRLNAPAGGIAASANDMARYIAMLLNGQDDLLSASGKAMLLQPSGPAAPFYGMGWYIDGEARYHTGLVPGSESLVVLLPAERKGAVVLVNANSGFGFAQNWTLRKGVADLALGLQPDHPASNWMPKATYLSVAILPPLFVLLAIISWKARGRLRAKRTHRTGLFSLWFPLPAMLALAWVLTGLMPRLFGGSLATLRLYQPDFALLMTAGAAGGAAWAVFRLILAYRGGRPA